MPVLPVPDVRPVSVVPLLEGVARDTGIGLHFSAHSFSDSGSIDHAVCESLPLDRAQGRPPLAVAAWLLWTQII